MIELEISFSSGSVAWLRNSIGQILLAPKFLLGSTQKTTSSVISYSLMFCARFK